MVVVKVAFFCGHITCYVQLAADIVAFYRAREMCRPSV